MNNETGKIYILTNKMFKDNIVKIGKTSKDDVEERIKELNRATGVPFPFECYSAFELENYHQIEKILHTAYSGAGRRISDNREFFEIIPEKARDLLAQLAKINNGKEIILNNEKIYSKEEIYNINEESKIIARKNSSIKKPFKFSKFGIPEGTILTFTRNDDIKCIVSKNNKVTYNNKEYSLSTLTNTLMNQLGSNSRYNGYMFWKLNNEILWDLRTRLENN